MSRIAIALAVLLTACGSSSTGLAGDPSILVTNDLQSSWVYVTWKDGQGIVGRDSVAPRTANHCVRFLAQPDSAYWEATATENGSLSTVRSPGPWFNPASRPAWSLHVYDDPKTPVPVPVMLQADASAEC